MRESSFVRRLRVGFAALIATSVLGLVFIAFSEQRVGSAMGRSKNALALLEDLKEVQISFSAARAAEREFLLEDLHSPNFFRTGSTDALRQHGEILEELDESLNSLRGRDGVDATQIADIQLAVSDYQQSFQRLVALKLERGSLLAGRIFEMREASFGMAELVDALDRAAGTHIRGDLIELDRDQGEYLRTSDNRPKYLVGERIAIVIEETEALERSDADAFREHAGRYDVAWRALLDLDQQIGISSGVGLRGDLRDAQERAVPLVVAAVAAARSSFESQTRMAEETALWARYGVTASAAFAVLLGGFLATWLGRHLRGSLAALMAAVQAYAGGDRAARVGVLPRRDEFATLGEAFDHLAETLAEATDELEEVNASLELAVKGDTTGLLEKVKRLTAQLRGRGAGETNAGS